MKAILLQLLTACILQTTAYSQLTGTKNIPGDYPDLATAITALNTQGVGAGGVTMNLLAGNSQTAPAGGYIIGGTGSVVLTTTNTTNPVVINGNNNIVTASSIHTAGSTSDGVFKLIGADWITIENFTIRENPLNTITTTASNNMTEWGFALLYVTTIDGANFNTILNNNISLIRTYVNSFGVYSNVQHAPSNPGVYAPIIAVSGTNTNNKIYGNQISNVNAGVAIVGIDNNPNLLDTGNEIGGSTAATGNTITNWGSGSFPTSFYNASGFNAIRYYNGKNLRISNNIIVSFPITSANRINGIECTYLGGTSPGGTYTITDNNITLTQNGNGGLQGIRLSSNSFVLNLGSLTVNVTGNTLSNCFTAGGHFTGIFINMTSWATISNNKFFNNISASTTGGFTGIQNNSEQNAATMNSNEFGNTNGGAIQFSNATSGSIIGIANIGNYQMQSLTISDNTFQGFSFVSSGAFTGISNSAPILSNITANNNKFGTATAGFATWNAANSSPLTCIANTNALSSCFISFNNNQFKGLVYVTPSSSPVTFISNLIPNAFSSHITSVGINSNRFDNLNINSSGSVIFVNNSATVYPPGSSSVSGNTVVTAFNKPVGGGAVIFAQITGTSSTSTSNYFTNNNFSNVTVTGSTNIIGCVNNDGSLGPLQNSNHKFYINNIFDNIQADAGSIEIIKSGNYDQQISSNTITNISNNSSITAISFQNPVLGGSWNISAFVHSNRIQNLSGNGDIIGIQGAFNVTTSFSNIIRQNIISDLSSSGQASVTAIIISQGINTISQNKIYNLSASHANGRIAGIVISGGETNSVENNLIGNLYANNSNIDNSINGISVTGGTTTNIIYNTIYLNASSSGPSFGSSNIYASTSPTVTLRNNILVNNSIPGVSGYSVAYRRSNTSLATYGSVSNNNLFYLNNSGPRNLVFYDGTNGDQTLAAFQARVMPRDAVSINSSPNFLSTTGNNAVFLHINNTIPTPIDGGAAPVAGITIDFDQQTRNATTPDIGADEFTAGPCPASIQVSPAVATICANGSVTLTASPGFNYLWSTGATTQSITVTNSGNYSVTGSVPGCATVNSNVVNVAVNPQPPIPIINASGPLTFCSGASVMLTAPTGFNYLWSNGATSQSITVTTSGNYSVTVSNASGCTSTSTPVTVTVNPLPLIPTITASGPTTFCQGGSVILTAPAGYTYLWNTGSVNQSITVTNSGNYSVTIRNSNNCSSTSAITTVTMNPLPATPSISASGPTTFCQGGSVTLTAPAGYTYLWNTGATTQSINVNTAGNYSVTITNINGCIATSAATVVTVHTLPVPLIIPSGPTTFCQGGFVTLDAPAGYSYLWSNGATTQNITVNTTGNYSVQITNSNGCSVNSAATVVTVNTPPTATITVSGPTTFCSGGTVTLSAPAGFTYLWNTGATTRTLTVSSTGNYYVTITNTNGCSSISPITTVTVNAAPPMPTIIPDGPINFCTGESVTLTAPAGYSYLWSTGATTQSITVSSGGSYNVRVINANNCSSLSPSILVTVNPTPPAPILTQVGNTLFSSAPSGNQWYLNGTLIPGATGNSYVITSGGAYSVTVTSTLGCMSAVSGGSFILSEFVQLGSNEKFYFKIYPSPFSTQLRIEYHLEQPHKVAIRLIDMTGKTIAVKHPSQQNTGKYLELFDHIADRLQRATYLVEFIIDDFKVSRMVIKH